MGKEKIILGLILFLGIGLRLVNINQSLWLDEAAQAVMSNKSISSIWFDRPNDFHPPLFYIVAHEWMQIQTSEIWLRILPLIFSCLNILVLYKFGNKIFPKNKLSPGLVASFLLAIAPFHIYYAQEFRSYSLLCLLGTISMYAFLQQKYRTLAIVNAALMYTHYASVFLIAAQVIYCLVYRKSQIAKFGLTLALSLILYIPWLPQLQKQLLAGVNIGQYLPGWASVLSISPIKAMPTILFKLVAGRINLMPRLLYGLYAITVMIISFVAIFMSQNQRKFLTVWTFVPIGVMLVVSLVLPQNQPFRIIFILPSLILMFTGAVMRFPKLFLTLFVYISVVGNLLYFTRPRLQREQWRQAGEFLEKQKITAIVKFPGSFAPLEWYRPNVDIIAAVPTFPAKQEDVLEKLAIVENKQQVLVLDYLTDLTDPQRLIEKTLIEKGFTETKITNFEGVGFIREFSKKP